MPARVSHSRSRRQDSACQLSASGRNLARWRCPALRAGSFGVRGHANRPDVHLPRGASACLPHPDRLRRSATLILHPFGNTGSDARITLDAIQDSLPRTLPIAPAPNLLTLPESLDWRKCTSSTSGHESYEAPLHRLVL